MTTLDVCDYPLVSTAKPARARPSLGSPFAAVWQAWRRHRLERRTLALLRQLDTRTLIDMGFEPAEIYGNRVGTWQEEYGDAWKGLK